MSKAKRGRPPLKPADRRSQELRIRLTVAERKLLDRCAGGKTSTWARNVLLRYIRKARNL